AAYTDGDPWLASLVERLAQLRMLLGTLLAEHLPKARMRPLEATYLVWLDLRGYAVDDPALDALGHGEKVAPGHDYQPGLTGHARLNVATTPERTTLAVQRLSAALS